MTSLYYAPLNKRVRSYYTDQALQQIDIDNDNTLNQQLLFDERMAQNAYTIFENQKKLTSNLKEEAKVLTDELLKEKYKKNPAFLALPPSEKSTLLAIENPESLGIEPPKYRSDIVPYEVKQKIKEEQKTKPKGATPKSGSPKSETGEMSPLTRIAEDAKLRVELKDNEYFQEFQKLRRKYNNKENIPIKDLMLDFANKHKINLDEYKENPTAAKLADVIIRGIPDIKKPSGSGLTFKKFMKKKYKR